MRPVVSGLVYWSIVVLFVLTQLSPGWEISTIHEPNVGQLELELVLSINLPWSQLNQRILRD